MRKLGLANL